MIELSRDYITTFFPWVLRVMRFVAMEEQNDKTRFIAITVKTETRCPMMYMYVAKYVSSLLHVATEDHFCHSELYTRFS